MFIVAVELTGIVIMSYSFRMDLSVLSSEEDMPLSASEYRPRHPQNSDYYRCVENYFESFMQVYDEHFSRQYGFWRPPVEKVVRPEIMSVSNGNPHFKPRPKSIYK